MKIYIFIICLFCIFFQNCTGQRKNNIEFIYQRSFFEEGKIIENFSYNSKTGIYEYYMINPGYEKITKKVIINLGVKDKLEIYNLYLKLAPKNLNNCMFYDDIKTYNSTINFENIRSSTSCNTNRDDELKYKKIEDKLYDLFSSNAAYRIKFPEEFIRK